LCACDDLRQGRHTLILYDDLKTDPRSAPRIQSQSNASPQLFFKAGHPAFVFLVP
jgi:hypothetical protein